jgi:hypothetical protein
MPALLSTRMTKESINLDVSSAKCGCMVKRLHILVVLLLVAVAGCGEKPAGGWVLSDFESDSDLDEIVWKCRTLFSLSEDHATHGRYSLKMELFPSEYPGFQPILSQKDWRGYRALCFGIYNPAGQEVTLTVRIDDRQKSPDYGDRYNGRFQLKPGMNPVIIPLDTLLTSQTGRKLSLKEIHTVIIFMVNPETKTVLYLDYLRLS